MSVFDPQVCQRFAKYRKQGQFYFSVGPFNFRRLRPLTSWPETRNPCCTLALRPAHAVTPSRHIPTTLEHPSHRTLHSTRSRGRQRTENAKCDFIFVSEHYVLSPVRLSSVVGNARAPYWGGSNFPQYFYGIWYLGHPAILDLSTAISRKRCKIGGKLVLITYRKS